jgi:hypothetical protein
LFVPACYVAGEGIVGPTTDKIEELIHASSTINEFIQNCTIVWSSFLNDTFGLMCAFHVDDTTSTSFSCFECK